MIRGVVRKDIAAGVRNLRAFLISLFIFIVFSSLAAQAEISITGDVSPPDSSNWANSPIYIGNQLDGAVSINQGDVVESGNCYLGYNDDCTGSLSVDGDQTVLYASRLYSGYRGSSAVSITNGGTIENDFGYIGYDAEAFGSIEIDGTNSSWTVDSHLYLGYYGSGIASVTNGGTVDTHYSYIGYNEGSIGDVTVDGIGSVWNSSYLIIGNEGSGLLTIANEGEVVARGDTYVAYKAQASGRIHFNDGILRTTTLFAGRTDLSGVGEIYTNGIVSDVDLIFDSPQSLSQSFDIDTSDGQAITVNLEVDGASSLGAGYSGAGSMRISQGTSIDSSYGYIGYHEGSSGLVAVDGIDSAWNSPCLYVGARGQGTLRITNGGTVYSTRIYIGQEASSGGIVEVEGYGSTLDMDYKTLYIGDEGTGALLINNGGTVKGGDVYIGNIADSSGIVTVNGSGSNFISYSSRIYVGRYGSGELKITDGGMVSSYRGYVGYYDGSTGLVTVEGADSIWEAESLAIGMGNLNISDGGFVGVAGTFTISNSDSYINMSNNGMLGILGGLDSSLGAFLDVINGNGTIRYWDEDVLQWTDLMYATYGSDYELNYITEGDWEGYTVLTVMAIPEPCTFVLLGLGGVICQRVLRIRGKK